MYKIEKKRKNPRMQTSEKLKQANVEPFAWQYAPAIRAVSAQSEPKSKFPKTFFGISFPTSWNSHFFVRQCQMDG